MQLQSLRALLNKMPANAEVMIETNGSKAVEWTPNFVAAYEFKDGRTVIKFFPDPCLWGDAAL